MNDTYDDGYHEETEEEKIPQVIMQKLTELSNLTSEFGDNWCFAVDLPHMQGGSFHYFHGPRTSPVWLKGVAHEITDA